MNKGSAACFAKGAVTGMLVGASVTAACKMFMDNNKNISKGSGKALKAVGDFVDGIHTMFK